MMTRSTMTHVKAPQVPAATQTSRKGEPAATGGANSQQLTNKVPSHQRQLLLLDMASFPTIVSARARSAKAHEVSTNKLPRNGANASNTTTRSTNSADTDETNAVAITTKSGTTIQTASCEEQQEVNNEKILLEPIVNHPEGQTNGHRRREEREDEATECVQRSEQNSHLNSNATSSNSGGSFDPWKIKFDQGLS